MAGILPPVNNIGFHERAHNDPAGEADNIGHAYALFRGLKRPMDSDDGAKIYIYVVRPRYAYQFIAHMVCVAKRVIEQIITIVGNEVCQDQEKFSSYHQAFKLAREDNIGISIPELVAAA